MKWNLTGIFSFYLQSFDIMSKISPLKFSESLGLSDNDGLRTIFMIKVNTMQNKIYLNY